MVISLPAGPTLRRPLLLRVSQFVFQFCGIASGGVEPGGDPFIEAEGDAFAGHPDRAADGPRA